MNSPNISFFFEDTNHLTLEEELLSKWLKKVIDLEDQKLTHLNYIFCSDEYLLKINVEYLDHDYYTDIITFDNSDTPNSIEGDLFISIDRVKDNANTQGLTFQSELNRVMVHGLLHLIGYKDKSESEQIEMRGKEDHYLALV